MLVPWSDRLPTPVAAVDAGAERRARKRVLMECITREGDAARSGRCQVDD